MSMQGAPFEQPPSLIIVAPNGARRSRVDHPALPDTPERMAACARECLAAGAGMIHVHARDAQGAHTLSAAINQQYYDAVCEAVGEQMLVQLTTEAVGKYQPDEQMQLIRQVRPMAASFALRELFSDSATESDIGMFFRELLDYDCLAQIILYSPEEVQRYQELKQEGLIPEFGHHLLFVLGRNARQDPSALAAFVATHQGTTPWAVCAFGPVEYPAAAAALAMGGDVRVGFENNLLTSTGLRADNNATLVNQARRLSRQLGRDPWLPQAFKEYCMRPNSAYKS